MLVIGRRVNEEIVINGNIRVVILGVKDRKTVRVGIEAPKEIKVLRRELLPAAVDKALDAGLTGP